MFVDYFSGKIHEFSKLIRLKVPERYELIIHLIKFVLRSTLNERVPLTFSLFFHEYVKNILNIKTAVNA